ncbi:MAG: tRNA threonylcarbamoyladenosine dehydratase [Firmicutes bacterium]|nr:tRNA threonylcarbamoyladenosine dehydratase [Bacillota bacterium]
MEHRFSRTEMVVGKENLRLLAASTVAVIGLGGVGGCAAEALARSGLGTLVLIDPDRVSISNLNRQIIALESNLGKPKVIAMKERIEDINPACRVLIRQQPYNSQTSEGIFSSRFDYVADAIDSVGEKVALIRHCLQEGIPIISALGTGNKLDPTLLTITDISETHTCPLARAVRVGLRREGIERGLPVVFSPEKCRGLKRGGQPGSTSFVPPAAGLIMASFIVDALCKGGG